MAESSPYGLYLDILKTFERLDIPYVIIGAFAGMSYGVTRLTADVDIVVDLKETHIPALAAAYPPPRFYADPQQMRDSIRLGIMFNLIDTIEGRKADLIPLTMKPGYGFALKRRVRRDLPLKEQGFSAWFARPDDVIVGKSLWIKCGKPSLVSRIFGCGKPGNLSVKYRVSRTREFVKYKLHVIAVLSASALQD